MIAALPMYARNSNKQALDRFWAIIRNGLRQRDIDAPDALNWDIGYRDSWQRHDLCLGQICVMPFQQNFRDDVTLIGAGDYAVEGCKPGFFRATLVCRSDDPRQTLDAFSDARFAVNSKHSFSGYFAPLHLARSQNVQLPVPIITGSHDASVAQVLSGTADFASIDAHTLALQFRDGLDPTNLRVLAQTDQAPGQSFITGKDQDPAPYRDAIRDAIAGLSNTDRRAIGLRALSVLPLSDYDRAVPQG